MQKLAYQAICMRKQSKLDTGHTTAENVKTILQDMKAAFNVAWPEAALWKPTRGKAMNRECRQFMWLSIHDRYMSGKKWLCDLMSMEQQGRAICKKCWWDRINGAYTD